MGFHYMNPPRMFVDLSCISTVVPTKSDSDVTFCLLSNQGLIIDRSLVHM